MTVEIDVGTWVRRRGRRMGKWHLVESVVAGDAFTRCGRRMRNEPVEGELLEVSDGEPLTRMIGQPQNCVRCS
jgi:hypothetical protein